jgi:hypothetical protein
MTKEESVSAMTTGCLKIECAESDTVARAPRSEARDRLPLAHSRISLRSIRATRLSLIPNCATASGSSVDVTASRRRRRGAGADHP